MNNYSRGTRRDQVNNSSFYENSIASSFYFFLRFCLSVFSNVVSLLFVSDFQSGETITRSFHEIDSFPIVNRTRRSRGVSTRSRIVRNNVGKPANCFADRSRSVNTRWINYASRAWLIIGNGAEWSGVEGREREREREQRFEIRMR